MDKTAPRWFSNLFAGENKNPQISVRQNTVVWRMAKVYGTKSTEEALKHLSRSLNVNPNDPFVHHAIGLQFYAVKCYQDAMKYFLKAEQIKVSPFNWFFIKSFIGRHIFGKRVLSGQVFDENGQCRTSNRILQTSAFNSGPQ